MSSVTFVDHSEAIQEKLNQRLALVLEAAAVSLADGFKFGLQANEAPPHSKAGGIPHAYNGHKIGGFGPVLGEDESRNNAPESGFDSVQTTFLSNYIRGGASGHFGTAEGYVGFEPSHVGARYQNYLIAWDTGRGMPDGGERRPWVKPLFRKNRGQMIEAMRDKMKEFKT